MLSNGLDRDESRPSRLKSYQVNLSEGSRLSRNLNESSSGFLEVCQARADLHILVPGLQVVLRLVDKSNFGVVQVSFLHV